MYIGSFKTFEEFVEYQQDVERRRSEAIRGACTAHRENDILKTCARHSLESDETGSAVRKAVDILGPHNADKHLDI